jgi:ApaG protein
MPTAVTEGIRVTVESVYLEDRSSPDEDTYAFAYVVAIANEGATRVQLTRRHWVITDGNGEVREVEGPGVVGEQPVLDPGGVHRYASGAVLSTPVGTMEGTYEMHESGGRVFRARIPRFRLQRPGVLQ